MADSKQVRGSDPLELRRLAEQSMTQIIEKGTPNKPIPINFRNVLGSVGNRDRYSHLIHWYPAKLFYRIPQFILLSEIGQTSNLVVDPFCGSGTVLLEALVASKKAYGVDINPIAKLIARVKTGIYDERLLQSQWEDIKGKLANGYRAEELPSFPNMDYWFDLRTVNDLARIRSCIKSIPDGRNRDFFEVCFSSIIRKVSLADPSVAPPVKLDPERLRKNNKKYSKALRLTKARQSQDVYAIFANHIERNIERVSRLAALGLAGCEVSIPSDATAFNTGLADGSADLIITSPPYMGAQKYVRSVELELFWLGYKVDKVREIDRNMVGTERVYKKDYESKPKCGHPKLDKMISAVYQSYPRRAYMAAKYLTDMRRFLEECKRILKHDGNMFLVIGNNKVCGTWFPMDKAIIDFAATSGLYLYRSFVDSIPSRGLMTRRNRTSSVIPEERILWFKKSHEARRTG